jgi:hypothetical protein
MAKIQTLLTPKAGEDMGPQGLSFIALEMQNGTDILEESLAVSYKAKHTLSIQSSNHTPWYLPK